MSKYLSPRLQSLASYVPGEQPQDMQYIKLNTNESPYPPAPSVIRAMTEGRASRLELYPEPDGSRLIRLLADHYGAGTDNIILGNGSDEILNFCFAAYFAGAPVLFPDITYGFYEVFAKLYGAQQTSVPLTEDLRVDENDYIGKHQHIVIANPNAPTGLALTRAQIERIVASNPDHIVVIDEAYVDFGAQSCVPLVKQYKNLIVTMTFSKSRSLAGARVGFAVADAELIADLNRIKYSTNPYNLSSPDQAAACAVMEESAYYAKNCQTIIQTRNGFCQRLRALGFVCADSFANFVFAKLPGTEGKQLYLSLKERGILVRHFDKDRIRDYLRITVGTPQQMNTLLSVLEQLKEEQL